MKRTGTAVGLALASLWNLLPVGQARGQEPGDKTPSVWAVVVSVEGYNAPIGDRAEAFADGRRLVNWFAKTAGWGSPNVLQLDDQVGIRQPNPNGEQVDSLRPTRENLVWALDTWLVKRAQRDDVVVFVFVGRGVSTPGGEGLLPVDVDPAGAGQNLWSPESAIERLIRDVKCSTVISLIDAPMYVPGGGPGAGGRLRGERLLNRLSRWPGASVWLSTADRAAKGGEGSAFAGALLRALGESPRTLLAALDSLNHDPAILGLPFRQRGGVPPELSLSRSTLRHARKPKPELLVQKGHSDRVTAVAFRADGRSMVSAGEDSTIRVWRPVELERPLTRVFPELLNRVKALAFSGDGRYLAGGDGNGGILAWNLTDPDPRAIAPEGARPHTQGIDALAFLPDVPTTDAKGQGPAACQFVSLGQDGKCVAWSLKGAVLRPLVRDLGPTVLFVAAARTAGPSAFVTLGWEGSTSKGRSVVTAFDRNAKPIHASVPIPGGRPTAFDLDAEGRRAALGDRSGRVRVIELATGKVVLDRDGLPGPVGSLRFGPGNRLAVGLDGGLRLIDLGQPDGGTELTLKENGGGLPRVVSIEFSPAGDWLGARTKLGGLALWSLNENGEASAVNLKAGPQGWNVSCLAFGPASSPPFFAAGENDGGIRRFALNPLKEIARLSPHRGKVRRLAASADGGNLLQVNADGVAQVWDLQAGRSLRTLARHWSSGAFLPDGRLVLASHPNDGGWISVVDPKTGRVDPSVTFARPKVGGGGLPAGGDFARVVASSDGRRVAAQASAGRDEVVLAWSLPAGTVQVIRGDERPLTSIDLSPDGRYLLTADAEGVVKVWDVDAKDGVPLVVSDYHDPRIENVTAARFSTQGPVRIAAAGRDLNDLKSLVIWWDWKPGDLGNHSPKNLLREAPGRVQAVTFLGKGRYVAAAGRDRQLWIWNLAAGGEEAELKIGVEAGQGGPSPPYHHTEAINDLLAWPRPEGPMLASGSDDSTIRLWRVEPEGKQATLLGTLASAPGEDVAPARPGRVVGDPPADAPWVAFTPEGVYDGSPDVDRLVCFVQGQDVKPLEQFAERLFHPKLTDKLRRSVRPPGNDYTPPPPLLIEAPEELDVMRRDVAIKVSLGDRKLRAEDLRLYLNDVPVRAESDFKKTDDPTRFVATVQLVHGDNKLYAMAGRPGDVDARSEDLTLFHAGADRPGRLHVVALGVSDYRSNKLQFPHRDAEEIANYLQRNGIGKRKMAGRTILLTNDSVTRGTVDKSFNDLHREVTGHPEDTVVVFLAGHTDILSDRFSLLLPNYQFPANAPLLALNRGPGVAGTALPKEDTYLPYAAIYHYLIRLDALQRLVIVDACQAEAVISDPGVAVVKQLEAMDRESRLSRTAYLLASRRGEPALEAAELKHGLLTYVLLRGMGDTDLEPPPADLLAFRDYPNADRNGDGRITISELRQYADLTLPALNGRMSGRIRNVNPGALLPSRSLEPTIQSAGFSFPLVALPLRVGALP